MRANDSEHGQCETTADYNVIALGEEIPFDRLHDNDNSSKQLNGETNNAFSVKYNYEQALPVVTNSIPTKCPVVNKNTINTINGGKHLTIFDRFCPGYKENLITNSPSISLTENLSQHGKESCSCDTYKAKRDMFKEELHKAMKFQNLWIDLRQYIRTIYNNAMETTQLLNCSQSRHSTSTSTNVIHDIVIQLCKRDPHQFFMRLIYQAQELVIETKVRLLAVLHDRSLNNLAEIFFIGLFDDYDALISTAIEISKLVQPLKEYLFKFNLTWDCFIQKLYQIYVYNDPFVQSNLPSFLSQLLLLQLKGPEYQDLVHRYLSFDDEMTRISNLWLETEAWMDKYNAEQAVRMMKLKQIREAWELFTATRKLMENSLLNKTPDVGIEMQEIHGQFSSLIAHTSDSPPLSPTIDFNSDSRAVPPSIEVVQILLDDWNKAQHQKLADITEALTATEVDSIGQDPKYKSNDFTHAMHYLGQIIAKSIRNCNDESDSIKSGLENGKEFECHSCNETEITQCKSKNIKRENISLSPSISNGLLEGSATCTATQIKKKLDNLCKDDIKKKESDTRGVLYKDFDIKTELEPCSCVYQHAQEIVESEILESPPCPCLLNSRRKWDTCPCLSKSVPGTVVTNGHPKAKLPASITKTNQESNKPTVKPGCTRSVQTLTRHSTTQTPNTSHDHNTHHDTLKNTGSTHRPHTHNNNRTLHACYKQASVEQIKRVSYNDLNSGDGDYSDSGSSQEDSSSTTSSAQRDINKHCDCCYCEVFGHGMQPLTPVRRNYNEMRERLRQLLTKKKAKKCKTNCSPSKSPLESSPSNTNSESKAVTNSVPKSNSMISMTPTVQQNQRDHRDLEELLEFIEGNQGGKKENNKKTEKKARQKQRKLEEKLKKDKEEAEKQKLIELQKKTPEVTITVVDPKKPVPPRLFPQCSLPEVSILPTLPPISLPVMKQTNNKKKDKQELNNCGNNSNSTNKISESNNKIKVVNGNIKSKNINSSEKNERNINFNQGNKNNTKNDKIECNKGSKLLANTNSISTKNNSGNNVEKLPNTDLFDKKLTKKERKKLKKEMKKLEDAKAKDPGNLTQTESEPQIVTIKRVIESNDSEPTVTITLKGQTPAEDKVLFTLVNGQTKELAHKPEQERNQNNNGKKKKTKPNTSNNQSQGNKSQQSNNSKQQLSQITTKTCDKNLKQQVNNEKSKISKQVDENKVQQQNINEIKNSKSRKGKKNIENKENVLQQQNTVNKNKNQNMTNKKQNKVNTFAQVPVSQKSQPNHSIPNDGVSKKTKKQQEKNPQINANKNNKIANANNTNQLTKNESQKGMNKTNQAISKQHHPIEIQNTNTERVNPPLSSQFKDIGPNSKINIEDLKLPPGITITKVVGPVKQLPIRTSSLPKPVNPPKQTTIIAAPMSGIQSSYASSQAAGNVIVVDTGKLKQDLLPKANEKDSSKVSQTQSTSTKKKKKKNKNTTNSTNTTNTSLMQNNDAFANDHFDEPARILHNPGTNMVTIRNPSFGPMKVPPTQQAAIIKVSENGMVTIRSPALQQAINAGLASHSKPDYIVKGDLSSSRTAPDSSNLNMKHTNSITPSSLAELRSRLTSDCTSLSGLANIQISKVTSGQPIPENGINLKGTSVTLTKVKSDANIQDTRQAKTAVTEATSIATSNSSKSKKKKKRGSGTKQGGDDWNLVESVFTPKDIDLEDEEIDDAERELEAFKRFCLQSVPPPRKEKVNLNIKDIVLKKKSSSSSATTTVIAAN